MLDFATGKWWKFGDNDITEIGGLPYHVYFLYSKNNVDNNTKNKSMKGSDILQLILVVFKMKLLFIITSTDQRFLQVYANNIKF